MSNSEEKYDFYCQEVLSGKTPVEKIYETERVLAFYHTRPSYEIHIVIIPKEHIEDLLSVEKDHEKIILDIITAARLITEDEIDYENLGAKLITNIGKFQDTPHLHFHLVAGKKIE